MEALLTQWRDVAKRTDTWTEAIVMEFLESLFTGRTLLATSLINSANQAAAAAAHAAAQPAQYVLTEGEMTLVAMALYAGAPEELCSWDTILQDQTLQLERREAELELQFGRRGTTSEAEHQLERQRDYLAAWRDELAILKDEHKNDKNPDIEQRAKKWAPRGKSLEGSLVVAAAKIDISLEKLTRENSQTRECDRFHSAGLV